MGGVANFEPDWAEDYRNLSAYVEEWKSATGD